MADFKKSLYIKTNYTFKMQSIKTSLKGIVPPKMTILLLITHPHVVPNP